MNNIVRPVKALSFEEALRNLASRLTGTPAAELPRTQEAIVQYMAEHINLPASAPAESGVDVNELAEAITQEVLARLAKTDGANSAATEPPAEATGGDESAGGTSSTPPATETPQDGLQATTEAASKTKTARKPKVKADK